MPALVSKSLRDYRRSLIRWTIGIGAFFTLYLSFYPNISENQEIYGPQALAKFPGAMRDLMGGMEDFTSGIGYLSSVVYQLFGPMLFIACAMILGNRAIAQPEESGTLELTVTLPVDRRRLVFERFVALVLGLLAVTVATFLLAWALSAVADMGVAFGRILAAHTGVFLLALLCGTLSLAVGAATGHKGLAMAVVGVVAVGGYIVETMGKNVDWISWLRWVSPFHYYLDGEPLYQGFPVGNYLVLAGATVVLLLTAILAFDRRDVGV
ncbi:ABC transporter permease [Planobispora rosea]|uniref:ABC transporter permease n=1 Tax=Planobispora rosea TaxID=35762 RepID=A0A8J3S8P9_PLARO|nr:ABC transporter permease subunit [Planobispora rosea]GGS91738.1 ABC transporter permease [Planobispora rosea]GIH87054.1 ABC transporter permease [Planobispora rosea]